MFCQHEYRLHKFNGKVLNKKSKFKTKRGDYSQCQKCGKRNYKEFDPTYRDW